MSNQVILEVKGLKKYFPITTGHHKGKAVKAVDGISFFIRKGETLGLVGESGSGKSTTAYCLVGIYSPSDGQMIFDGEEIGGSVHERPLSVKKEIGMVFQDPGTTLNPQRSVKQILSLPLSVHGLVDKEDPEGQILQLLDAVELPPECLFSYPASLGGGERQMLAIARALATDPPLIVLDEPTSSLDVSIQAKIINMLLRLQAQRNIAYLFITHDLSLMRNLATRVAIMYLGKIAEVAPTETFFITPRHPYTQMLLSAIPVVSEEEEVLKPSRITPRGEIPSPVDVPPGCSFNTRCPFVIDTCFELDPEMRQIEEDHWVRCHLVK